MKRYILLLALISMQANVTLPIFEDLKSKVSTFIGSFRTNVTSPKGTWGSFKSNFKSSFASRMNSVFGFFKFRTAQAQEISSNPFDEQFDKLVPAKNLTTEAQDNVLAFKNECRAKTPRNFNKLSHEKQTKEMQKQIAQCLTQYTQAKTENVFDKAIIPLQDMLKNEKDEKYAVPLEMLSFLSDELTKRKQEMVQIFSFKASLGSVEKSENCTALFDGTFEKSLEKMVGVLAGDILDKRMNDFGRMIKIMTN